MMNPPTGKVTRLKTNSWSKPLYQYPSRYDYKIAFGGRGSSKTYEVTQALTILGHIRPLRICIAREHLNSITESALPEMLDRMRNLGLMRPDCYEPTLTHIDHRNGTHVFFMGLSKMSEEDIKGLAQVDILWIEEAHTMSPTSWEKIRPTIRKDDSEIWASFNPERRTQPIWKFTSTPDPDVWTRKVTWRDNQFFTARNERERQRSLKNEPERAGHIWEGELDDLDGQYHVIPAAHLDACWGMHLKYGHGIGSSDKYYTDAGIDVGGGGANLTAMWIRRGPHTLHVEEWHEPSPRKSAKKAYEVGLPYGVDRVFYDETGIGYGFGERLQEVGFGDVQGVLFGGKVTEPDLDYDTDITNGAMFDARNMQMAWNMHDRIMDTYEYAMDETRPPPGDCFFLPVDHPLKARIEAQLTQPVYERQRGKMRLEKEPAGQPSPDLWDACCLAHAADSEYGLERRH